MADVTISRWARRFVLVGVGSLLGWQVGGLVGIPAQTEVVLGLYGFVLHVVFGKAYSLIPTYFDRSLARPRVIAVQFPLSVAGMGCLAAAPFASVPPSVGRLGAVLWAAGVLVFLGLLAWTIRDNPSGAETATAGPNRHRQGVDRLANAFMPLALGYLALGSYETLAVHGLVPPVFDGYPPRVVHLLGAGTATLLVFAIGFRLLPRFLRARPPRWLVGVVLPAGAIAPVLLAATLPAGSVFRGAAALMALSVVGYAAVVIILFVRAGARRLALYGVLAGAVGGVAAIVVGGWMAVSGPGPDLVGVHRQLTLLGFLGLTIVGVSLQFYPPNVGAWPGSNDRTGALAIGGLAGGVALFALGGLGGLDGVAMAGRLLSTVGVLAYGYLLVAVFATRQ